MSFTPHNALHTLPGMELPREKEKKIEASKNQQRRKMSVHIDL